MTAEAGPHMLYVAVALALAGCLMLVFFARGAGRTLGWALRTLAIWLGAGILLILAFAHRGDLANLLAEQTPADSSHVLVVSALPQPQQPSRPDVESVRFTAGQDGHFRVDAMVNGAPVKFLVDTGANIVVLTQADARHIGLDPDGLAYSAKVATANGTAPAAPVLISEIVVGPIRMTDVVAVVDRQNTMTSLLGMSFLSRLQGYEVSAGALTLH